MFIAISSLSDKPIEFDNLKQVKEFVLVTLGLNGYSTNIVINTLKYSLLKTIFRAKDTIIIIDFERRYEALDILKEWTKQRYSDIPFASVLSKYIRQNKILCIL